MNTFTETDYAEWVRLYLAGSSTRQIAMQYNTDRSTIQRRLHTMGIEMRPPARRLKDGTNVDAALVEAWREAYEQGETTYEIAARYNVAASTVTRRLTKAGVAIRPDRQRQPFGDPFEKLTADMAWLLGLLYTDRNIYKNRVRLASQDRDILEKSVTILSPFNKNKSLNILSHAKTAGAGFYRLVQLNSSRL